jgi:hypothetical protein
VLVLLPLVLLLLVGMRELLVLVVRHLLLFLLFPLRQQL